MSEPAARARAAGAPLHAVVFSYNRGAFLEHCVGSIERHAPEAAILVVDDLSDEPATLAALERIERRHRVLRPESTGVDNPKVGGLYANMQLALESLPDDALFCFLQEDMQIVRDVGPADIEAMRAHFAASPRAGFLFTNFLRGYRRERLRLHWDEARGCYFREVGPNEWGAHFAAVVTSRVDRLRAVDWRFENREKLNDAQAARLFEPMGYLRDPFAMFLPSVPVYRYRRKSLALRLAERRIGAGLHPYRPLEGEALRRLRERDVATALPFAEDWLETESGEPPKPWCWGPFQNSRWLRKLDKLERVATWLPGSVRRRWSDPTR